MIKATVKQHCLTPLEKIKTFSRPTWITTLRIIGLPHTEESMYVMPIRYNIGTRQTDGRTDRRKDGQNYYISIARQLCCADAR